MIVPVLHRLLVKPIVETKSAGGIVLAVDERKHENASEIGEVLAIGDTAFKDYNTEVMPKVGDKIYYAKFAGKFVTHDNERLVMLNDEDVVGIIKDE